MSAPPAIEKHEDTKMEITPVTKDQEIEYDDPHLAAVEQNPDKPENLSWTTLLAICFLGLSTVGPISCGILLVPTILTPIGQALGGIAQIGWIPSSWAIASSVSFCVAGRLSDVFGRRSIILAGEVVAVVGAIVAAAAQTMGAVIAGSTLLGFACGLVLVCFAGIPELLPFKYRGVGLAWVEVCIFVPWGGFAVLIANELETHGSWRWPYYIAIIYGAASLIGTFVFYKPQIRKRPNGELSTVAKLAGIDYTGLGLYTIGLTVLLVGLSWAGTPGHAWQSASVVAPIVVGAATFLAAFAYDFTIGASKEPFFPLRLFVRFRQFSANLIVVFVAGFVYYAGTSLVPEATFYIFSNNGFQLGLISLPNGVGQLFGSIVLPAILHKTKHPKNHILVALFIQTFFTGLYVFALPNHKAAWMAFQFFGQGCFSWITVCTLVNVGLHVPQSDLGLATGVIGTFRSAGGSVGDAVLTTILKGTVASQIGARVASAALANNFDARNLGALITAVADNALGIPDAFADVPGVTPAIEAAAATAYREAYGHAFRMVFYATIPFGVAAIVCALFIQDAGEYMTNHTSVHLEKEVIGMHHKSKNVEMS